MEHTIEQSDGTETIILGGEMTISSADDLKELLTSAISGNDEVRVNLEQITEVDLSALQLLCSAHRTSIKMGKSFTRTGVCPETLRSVAERGGFLRHAGCKKDCIWAGMYEK